MIAWRQFCLFDALPSDLKKIENKGPYNLIYFPFFNNYEPPPPSPFGENY